MSERATLLRVEGLRVAFAGKAVVHDIAFDLAEGERLALVGESGSGKSVTALSLLRLALNATVTGRALFQGRDLLALTERELRAVRGADMAMIFQEPMTALNPVYTVGDQIAEVLQIKRGLDRRSAWAAAVEALAATGIPEPERRAGAYPHQLSGGQRQRAMIAMALACRPRLLLADEPTTALDASLRLQMLELLAQLQREHGMALVLITHDLPLVQRFADRVAVMERGHIVEQGTVRQVFEAPAHAYTKRLLDSRPRRLVADSAAPAEGQEPVLRGRGVRVSYPVHRPGVRGWFSKGSFTAVQGVDFDLPPARTLGVVGESGSGKSTLAMAALGLLRFEGEMAVADQAWRGGAADRALRRQIQVVFQDPFSSLSPRMTVEEIVGEGLLIHEPQLTPAQRRERVTQALGDVGLDDTQFPGLLGRYPHEFSGGQRQRLAIARALIVEPQVLVLDEPTSALDVTIQQQVLALLQRLQHERGLSYLLITHDIDVIRAMAHEVIVMKDGAVVDAGAVADVLDRPRHAYTRLLVEASGPGSATPQHDQMPG